MTLPRVITLVAIVLTYIAVDMRLTYVTSKMWGTVNPSLVSGFTVIAVVCAYYTERGIASNEPWLYLGLPGAFLTLEALDVAVTFFQTRRRR